MMLMTETSPLLAPATVLEVEPDRLRIELADGTADWARQALGYSYTPVTGDEVLVIGDSERYVIGVLYGQGASEFVAPGDLTLMAGGRVNIVGGKGINLTGPTVQVEADRFEVLARSAFEKVTNSYRWVKELVQTYAGCVRTVCESSHSVDAQFIVMEADKDISINGERVHLG